MMVPELMTGPLPTITRTLVTARSWAPATPETANDPMSAAPTATPHRPMSLVMIPLLTLE
jgi:hypothetical protein